MKLLVLFCAFVSARVQCANVQDYGAVGNGQVATDCSMTASSAVLSCSSAHFVSGDVGKVIAVYESGPTTNRFLQPLSTTIARFTDSLHVTLGASATTSASPSSRVVWGTDNTSAVQAAVDAQAAASGGTVTFPAGMYLLRSVELPCSTIGTFAGHSCTRVYNNITLSGASASDTILENWDITVNNSNTGGGGGILSDRVGVINLGRWASASIGNNPLSGILITQMSVNQVKNPSSNGAKGLSSGASQNVEISNFTLTSPSYEGIFPCGGDACTYWSIHDGTVSNVGFGGPGYSNTTSGVNLNSSYSSVYNMLITNCAQGIELGGHDDQIYNNQIIGPPNFGYNGVPINVNSGWLWRNSITNNTISNWASGGGTGNVLGISTQWTITGNTFHNVLSGFGLSSGLETNAVTPQASTVVPPPHGSSTFSNNAIIYDDAAPALPNTYPIRISPNSLESWTIANNTIQHATRVCGPTAASNAGAACFSKSQCGGGSCTIPVGVISIGSGFGGGPKWTPSAGITGTTSTLGIVRPNIDNGYYYSTMANCSTGTTEPTWPTSGGAVKDNTCTWSFAGKYPTALIDGLTVTGPLGAQEFGNDIAFQIGANRRALSFRDLTSNYSIQVAMPGGTMAAQFADDAPLSEIIPAGAAYSDNLQYASSLPTGGYYIRGDLLLNDGSNWIVTRAGYAAPAWAPTQSYTFGYFVVPQIDNGHFYLQTAAGCASGGSTPAFPAGSGDTVSDGSCSWRESGAAVHFVARSTSRPVEKPRFHRP